ncbi:MAG: SNF2-related protein [Opitutaceae bacterium]
MAKSRQHTTRSVKSPEAIAALRTWLATFDERTRERGLEYFERGHADDVWADADHFVEALVAGQELYSVELFYTRGQWTSQCTCRKETNCQHIYAAGLSWLAEVEIGASDARDLDPVRLPKIAPLQPSASKPASRKKSFSDRWSPVLAEKLGRPLSDDERRQLGQLSALFTEFSQSFGTLYPGALERHGFAYTMEPGESFYAAAFPGWWSPNTAPRDPWALWQYIAYDYELHGRTIPEAFRPMTDTRAVHDMVSDRLVQQELESWRRALRAASAETDSVEPNPIAGAAGVRARLGHGGGLLIEVCPARDKPWKPPTQKWLRDLRDARPADFEYLPAAEAALGLALGFELRHGAHIHSPKLELPPNITSALLRHTAARGAVLLPDGSPFAIEPGPLVPQATVSHVKRDRLQLQLITPDGRDATAARPVILRPQPLYLFENRLWRGPPPVPKTLLPTAALNDPKIMTPLRAAGLRLPTSLEVKVRRVTLRPMLRCWLTTSSAPYQSSYFKVRLVARNDEVPCAQEWSGEGGWHWAPDGEPPMRRPDDPVLELDFSAAHAVSARFADFRLSWDSWDGAWSRYTSKTFPEEFIAWHASLPPGATFEASPEIASLLGPPLRAVIEFSAAPAMGSGRDWFDLTVALRVEDTTLRPEEIELLLKAPGKWVSLPRIGWRRIALNSDEPNSPAAATLDRLGLAAVDVLASGKPATHRLHALQLATEAGSLESRDAALAAALRERASALAALPLPPLPAGLTATLRPYQQEGFHFLAHLSANGFGGVLADDMGLGKTVQTLAWLLHLAAAANRGSEARPGDKDASTETAGAFRALVVCPKSVTHGWLTETARFAPALAATAFTPALATGASVPAPKSGLLIANYAQLRLHSTWFQQQAWDAVVLDEGQFIKNPGSQVAVVARALPSRHRLVLTGTPIENRLTDLWSLFAFAQPGILGTQAAFRRQYDEDDPAALARLHRRVHHFLLRRTKAQAAPDLPLRTEDDIVVELEGGQRQLYDAELKRARAQLLGISTDRALDAVRFNILASLLRLRQICCHPALIDPAHRDLPSAKLEALLERLEELRDEGHQVLVFSQFVEMLEIIRVRLNAAGINHLMLTGATENRAELVDTFQSDRTKTVFLLSLKAAGFGLNLTAASYAILYDPWWNPAVEAQAIDRTHRIGQTQPVVAYRLLADQTVEQKIRALQHEKAALARAVVQEESLGNVLDLDSLRQILG